MAAAQRLRRPGAGRPVVLDLEHEPARCGRRARKSSTGSVRSPPLPVERTRAPSAISGAPRSPRCAPTPGGAQRLPPTVARARTSGSAISARSGASSAVAAVGERRDRHHRADPDDVAVGAQLVEPAAVEHQGALPASAGPRRSRASGSCRRRTTVIPSPSPKSSAASSAERGNERLRSHGRFYVGRGRASNGRRAPATLRACRSPRSTSSSRRSPERRICPTAGSRPRSISR